MNGSRASLIYLIATLSLVACSSGTPPKRRDSGPIDPVQPDAAAPADVAVRSDLPVVIDMAIPADAPLDGGAADVGDVAPPPDVARDVTPPAPNEYRVAAASDDAEEYVSDTGMPGVDLGSSDLEITRDIMAGRTQVIGLRFAGVLVPPGARITAAYVQFTSRIQTDMNMTESPPDMTSYTIHAEAADNATTFTVGSPTDISARPKSTASATWSNVPLWGTATESSGPDQRTPSLNAVIQELVDRPGWASGNAVVLIIGGTGTRSARSYTDNAAEKAPILHVEFGAATDGGAIDSSPGDGGADASPADAGTDAAPADADSDAAPTEAGSDATADATDA